MRNVLFRVQSGSSWSSQRESRIVYESVDLSGHTRNGSDSWFRDCDNNLNGNIKKGDEIMKSEREICVNCNKNEGDVCSIYSNYRNCPLFPLEKVIKNKKTKKA